MITTHITLIDLNPDEDYVCEAGGIGCQGQATSALHIRLLSSDGHQFICYESHLGTYICNSCAMRQTLAIVESQDGADQRLSRQVQNAGRATVPPDQTAAHFANHDERGDTTSPGTMRKRSN